MVPERCPDKDPLKEPLGVLLKIRTAGGICTRDSFVYQMPVRTSRELLQHETPTAVLF